MLEYFVLYHRSLVEVQLAEDKEAAAKKEKRRQEFK